MTDEELMEERLKYFAYISYRFMMSRSRKWRDGTVSEQTKSNLRNNCISYLVYSFIPNLSNANTQEMFDEILRECVTHLVDSYSKYIKGDQEHFGFFAKWVNSFLKFVALSNCTNIDKILFHCPIDSYVLRELGKQYPRWSVLSYDQYCARIKIIREHCNNNSTNPFEWELSLWNRLNN